MESNYFSSEQNSNEFNQEILQPVTPDEFLPSISRWLTLGSLCLLAMFGGTIALASILKYNVTVKAPASLRPVGDLRLVQAASGGSIKSIRVKPNQLVEKGEAIAYIDDSSVQAKKRELQENIQQNQLQLAPINAQIRALDRQIIAEIERYNRSVAGANAELKLQRRNHRNLNITSVAEVHEAQASLELAKDELARYQHLAKKGAISSLQLKEKETNVKTATARLEKVNAYVNPSSEEIAIAIAKIAQEKAGARSVLANLHQEREQLIQQQLEIQNRLAKDKQTIKQVEIEIQKTIIRAPISGFIQNVNLRNSFQVVSSGDTIAQIAPNSTPLEIKALVASKDIARVETGQKVQMRVSACPYPDYGTLKGTVKTISPDAILAHNNLTSTSSNSSLLTARVQNPNTYDVTIEPENHILSLGTQNCEIQSGMEGQVDIISKEETILRFILRKARLIADF